MPVVQSTVLPVSGVIVTAPTVNVRLVTGSRAVAGVTDSGEIVGRSTATPDEDGAWSMTLVGNGDITPSGTYYEITEAFPATGDATRTYISVPTSGGPYQVADVQVAVPSSPGGVGATVTYVDAHDATTLAAARTYAVGVSAALAIVFGG